MAKNVRQPSHPVAPRAPWPWDDAQLELAEVSSIKAIAAQHPVGFAAIIDKICRTDLRSFTPGGEDGRRASDYAEGGRGVGRALRAIAAMKMPTVTRGAPPNDLPNSPTPAPVAQG